MKRVLTILRCPIYESNTARFALKAARNPFDSFYGVSDMIIQIGSRSFPQLIVFVG